MKVAWDARVLAQPHLRGIGSYATHVLREMKRARPDWTFELFSDMPLSDAARAQGCHVHVIGPSRGYRWQLWERLGLPWHAARAGAALLHSPANTIPRRSSMPRIVTVHDVIPYLPHVADPLVSGHYATRYVPDAVRRADAIVTDSNASRDDIIKTFGVSGDRITVIPLAVDTRPRGEAVIAAGQLRRDYGIEGPYLLALAASDRRKNTPGVVRIFAALSREVADVTLVLTGVTPQLRPSIERQIVDLGIASGRVILLGFVDAAVRDALYGHAAAFLFLSLYEGFGLPILEAMQFGAPVICSDRSSCPEVAGDAAVLVDPEHEPAIVRAARDVLALSASERREWQTRGQRHADTFTWERTARATLDVYDRVLARS